MEFPDASLSHESESLPVLPSEILYEILLRLPVKTLLKMRCVSKSWFSLISCPQFIKTHLKFSTQNQDFRCLFYGSRENSLTLNTCSLDEIIYQEESPPIPIAVQLDFPCNGVLGVCEGLFCIFNQFWYIFIWNPSIRKSKKLPFSGLDPRCGQSSSYGFGYVECQDDYKVVDVKGNSHGDGFLNVFKIYSLRYNSWKRIQDYPDITFWIYPGKFVNGRLHWIVGHVSDESDMNDSRFILSLNLVDDTYKNVALPDLVDASFDWDIGSLGGNLCVSYTCDLVQMDVWVMKVYGLVESWTKVYCCIIQHKTLSSILRFKSIVAMDLVLICRLKVLFHQILWRMFDKLWINE
nr:F-box protein CPR1-like isoform X2 [Nicotiana tomentosiformis]